MYEASMLVALEMSLAGFGRAVRDPILSVGQLRLLSVGWCPQKSTGLTNGCCLQEVGMCGRGNPQSCHPTVYTAHMPHILLSVFPILMQV